MRTVSGGMISATIPDSGVYIQEKNVLNVLCQDQGGKVKLYAGSTAASLSLLATYQLSGDNGDQVVIDISDLLRYTNKYYMALEDADGERVTFSFNKAGLISPDSVIVPNTAFSDAIRTAYATTLGTWNGKTVILPPSRILQTPNKTNTGMYITFELYPYSGILGSPIRVRTKSATTQSPDINPAYNSFTINKNTEPKISKSWQVVELSCGVKYALVEWVSFTGAKRRHTFEVRDVKTATANAVNYETIDGSFSYAKGREDSFTLFIDDLTAYDLWYYSDLCHSSNVMVCLDGETWRSVLVETAQSSTQDGDAGEKNKLEVSVKYAKYDAVNL